MYYVYKGKFPALVVDRVVGDVVGVMFCDQFGNIQEVIGTVSELRSADETEWGKNLIAYRYLEKHLEVEGARKNGFISGLETSMNYLNTDFSKEKIREMIGLSVDGLNAFSKGEKRA